MKMKSRTFSPFMSFVLALGLMPLSAFAQGFSAAQSAHYSTQSSNPYPYRNYDGTVACTWYVWQQAYERLGVVIPSNWGNGGQWYDSANAISWTTGTTPRANSLAVWKGNPGHVAYVTWAAADGNSFTYDEAGTRNSRANSDGIQYPMVTPIGPVASYISLRHQPQNRPFPQFFLIIKMLSKLERV